MYQSQKNWFYFFKFFIIFYLFIYFFSLICWFVWKVLLLNLIILETCFSSSYLCCWYYQLPKRRVQGYGDEGGNYWVIAPLTLQLLLATYKGFRLSGWWSLSMSAIGWHLFCNCSIGFSLLLSLLQNRPWHNFVMSFLKGRTLSVNLLVEYQLILTVRIGKSKNYLSCHCLFGEAWFSFSPNISITQWLNQPKTLESNQVRTLNN